MTRPVMSGPVRMLATDLDGTLLRPDGTVSTFTRDAIAGAVQRGIHVVYATGRPPRWITGVVEATGHAGVVIAANGAMILDMPSRAVAAAHPFELSDLRELVDVLQTWDRDLEFAVEFVPSGDLDDPTAFGRSPRYLGRLTPPDQATNGPINELIHGRPVVKLLVRGAGGADDLLAAARVQIDTLAEVTHSNAGDSLLEVMPRGTSKGVALAAHARRLGLGANEVVAIGDMPNDVSMLMWAGRSYAIAGAHPEAIAAAEEILDPPEQDGVGRLLASLDVSTPTA